MNEDTKQIDQCVEWFRAWRLKQAQEMGLGDNPRLTERADRMAQTDRERLTAILTNGLDIGGIVRHVVPVNLDYHEQNGWVFVRSGGYMYRVADTLLKA